MADTLDMTQEEDIVLRSNLREVLGDFFADRISGDAAWSRGVLGANNGT